MAESGSRFFLATLMVSLLLAVVVQSQPFFQQGRYGKRAEAFRVVSRGDERFFGGPRFGRSGAELNPASSDAQARNPERFFIGSRYGKRSEIEEHTIDTPDDLSGPDAERTLNFLLCQFTGIGKLFYCDREASFPLDKNNASSSDQLMSQKE